MSSTTGMILTNESIPEMKESGALVVKNRAVMELMEKCELQEKKIQELEYDNESSKKELAELTEQLAIANKIVDELAKPEKILLASPNELEQKLEQLERSNAFMHAEMERCKSDTKAIVAKNKREVATLKKEIDRLNTGWSSTFMSNHILTVQHNKLKEDLKFASDELLKLLDEKEERLNREQAEMEEDSSDESGSDSDASDSDDSDDSDSDDSGEESDSSTESDEKEEYLKNLEYELKSKDNKIVELEKDVTDLKQRINLSSKTKITMEKRTEELIREKSKLHKAVDKGHIQIIELKASLKKAQDLCGTLTKQLEEQQKLNAYQNQVTVRLENELTCERSEKQAALMSLSDKVATVMKRSDERCKNYEAMLTTLQKKNSEMHSKLEDVENEIKSASEEYSVLKRYDELLEIDFRRSQNTVRELRQRETNLESELDRTMNNWEKEIQNNQIIEKSLAKAEQQNKELLNEIGNLKEQIDNMGVEEIDTDFTDSEEEPEAFEEVRAE